MGRYNTHTDTHTYTDTLYLYRIQLYRSVYVCVLLHGCPPDYYEVICRVRNRPDGAYMSPCPHHIWRDPPSTLSTCVCAIYEPIPCTIELHHRPHMKLINYFIYNSRDDVYSLSFGKKESDICTYVCINNEMTQFQWNIVQ